MHRVIIDDLEEYLAGTLLPAGRRQFETHIRTCSACKREVDRMRDMAQLFASLKLEDPAEPSPSFLARTMASVAARPAFSFWNPFVDFAFGRRVVFASLLMLAVLGTVLVSRETAYAPAPTTPEAVMAYGQNSPTPGGMLVTLASYDEP